MHINKHKNNKQQVGTSLFISSHHLHLTKQKSVNFISKRFVVHVTCLLHIWKAYSARLSSQLTPFHPHPHQHQPHSPQRHYYKSAVHSTQHNSCLLLYFSIYRHHYHHSLYTCLLNWIQLGEKSALITTMYKNDIILFLCTFVICKTFNIANK